MTRPPLPATPVETPGEIRALTGLRGLAALYVVIFHTSLNYAFPSFLLPFVQHGYMAVDLFFLLSGFVMALTAGSLFENGFTFTNYKRFLVLRLARIYPLYLLVTLFTAVFVMLALHASDMSGLFFNLTLTDIWGMAPPIVTPSWSISAEWAAYLLFPVLLLISSRSPKPIAGIGVIIAFATLTFIVLGPHRPPTYNHISQGLDVVGPHEPGTVPRCLAEFYLGLTAYRFRHLVSARLGTWLAAAALILLSLRNTDLALVGVFAATIMALSRDQGHAAKWLQSRWVHWLGLISYALYLVHDLMLRLISALFPAQGAGPQLAGFVAVAAIVGLSVGVASLCHYGFEKPARLWFRTFFLRGAATRPTSAPAKAV